MKENIKKTYYVIYPSPVSGTLVAVPASSLTAAESIINGIPKTLIPFITIPYISESISEQTNSITGYTPEFKDIVRSAWEEYNIDRKESTLDTISKPVLGAESIAEEPNSANGLAMLVAKFNSLAEADKKAGNKVVYRKVYISDFLFTRAPDTGANKDHLYIKDAKIDTYLGKITPTGIIKFGRDTDANQKDMLEAMLWIELPELLSTHGRETGICSCCGRTLTNPESIAAGIGPICASGWI